MPLHIISNSKAIGSALPSIGVTDSVVFLNCDIDLMNAVNTEELKSLNTPLYLLNDNKEEVDGLLRKLMPLIKAINYDELVGLTKEHDNSHTWY